MKSILILVVVVLLGSNCIGQKVDTIPLFNPGYGLSYSSKQDTVRVLMLVCDTSFANYYELTDTGDEIKIGGITKWIFGYEVYENYFVPAHEENNGDTITLYDDEWRSRFVARLDQNKKRLNKSIVVWMTKEIRQ